MATTTTTKSRAKRKPAPTRRVTAFDSWYGTNRTNATAPAEELVGCKWIGVPCAGSMCEVPALIELAGARTVQVNDIHRAVINMARVTRSPALRVRLYQRLKQILFHPDELRAAQERCILREKWADDADELFAAGFPDARFDPAVRDGDVDWAADYFVCGWMARHGAAGTAGELAAPISFRFDAGGGDSNVHFRSAARELVTWTRVFRSCNFSTLDVRAFLRKCKDEPGIGIYVDLPFPGPGDLYKHRLTAADHAEIAKQLAGFSAARVVCRFYRHPMVEELYPPARGWRWRELTGGRDQQNQDKPEVLLVRNGAVA